MSCGICGGFFGLLLLFLCLFKKFLSFRVIRICLQQFVQALDCLIIVSFISILFCLGQLILTGFFCGLLFCFFISSFFGGSFLGSFLFSGGLFSCFLFSFLFGSFFGSCGFCCGFLFSSSLFSGGFFFSSGLFSCFLLSLVLFVQFFLGFIQKFFSFRVIWICFQKSIHYMVINWFLIW